MTNFIQIHISNMSLPRRLASCALLTDVTATCRLAGGPLNCGDRLSLSSVLIYGGVAITLCTEAEEGGKDR